MSVIALAGLAACSGSAENGESTDADTLDAAPMTVQSFVEQLNDDMCDAAMICGADYISIYCDPLPFDPMDYEGCTLNEVVVDACLTDDWTCFHGSMISALLPPDSCTYAMDCPEETTTTTPTDYEPPLTCSCTVEWVADVDEWLRCDLGPELCRGEMAGGVWDTEAGGWLDPEDALLWSSGPEVDLADGPETLVFFDVPCGPVTGYVYLERNGTEFLDTGDVGSATPMETWECVDGGTVRQEFFMVGELL